MAGLTLITGGPGSGKTTRLVELAAAAYAADPFAPILVLVPTVRHADQFRRRVVGRTSVAFGLDVTTIGQFGQRFLQPGAVVPVLSELRAHRRPIRPRCLPSITRRSRA